ncbi:MAG: diadenylate cyclase CdaA [Treponemataceae bacterium]|nr:diadenylate cyclase CdaA [Treponemataceae bacterium]MDE6705471.1 diadenylate cyclase CdaA [Treponemataceae bacterium]MDE7140005.1 diadenylate cyclase CdaA [Treponemataceae bacterium]
MNALDVFLRIYNQYFSPVIDIGIMAFLLYKVHQLFIKTNAVLLIKAAGLVAGAYVLAVALNLQMLRWLMNILAPALAICFAIVFQPELRKIFLKLGQTEWLTFGNRSRHTYVDSVIIAAEMLSKQRRGMLAVFMRHTKMDDIMDTGTRINADVSSALLVTIFGHDTPLHDGACFIQNGKVVSAGCFLPLSEQYDIKKTFGTRHRAALGLSEVSDSVVLVVSEESGALSLAYDSKLHYDLSTDQLTKILENLLELTPDQYTIEDTVDESASNC